MSRFDWRQFGALLVLGLLAYVFGLPYTLALAPFGLQPPLTVLFAAVVQTAALLVVAIAVGQYFGAPLAFGTPVLDALLRGESVGARVRRYAPRAILWGIGVGAALVVIDVGLLVLTNRPTVVASLPPLWTRALAAVYGGVFEEILLRFGLMTFFVWAAWRLAPAEDGGPTDAGVWAAIVLASLVFGVGHLPITAASGTPITPYIVGRALLLNGLAGIVFGWLYWREGILAAMLAHFTADVTLHVVGLTLLSMVL
ncbi:MAG: CPBP family intramembrane glutamic endopeptidase [Halanaeroarchaeum sp.]